MKTKAEAVKPRHRYSERHQVLSDTEGPSRTKQSHKDECDVNQILKKYKATGLIQHVQNTTPAWGDFTNVDDYQSSINKVIEAQQSFGTLPAHVRKRFENDPGQLIAFLEKNENYEEAKKMGLVQPKNQPEKTMQHNVQKAKKEDKKQDTQSSE